MPERFAKLLQEEKVKLSPNSNSWVTAAEDLKGITSTEEMAKKLTLIDKEGALRLDSNAVLNLPYYHCKTTEAGDCVAESHASHSCLTKIGHSH